MSYMFDLTSVADPDVSGWNTSNVVTMEKMFGGAQAANPEVGAWDTSSLTNVTDMFLEASAARPDFSSWDVASIESFGGFLRGSEITVESYSNLLIALQQQNTFMQRSLISGDSAKYNASGQVARDYLINTLQWGADTFQ